MHATVSPSMTSRRSPLRHTPLVLALAACLCAAPLTGHAQVSATQLPTGGSIAGGTGTINAPSGASLTINQTSARMALTWGSFDIGSAATVTFNQPSSSAVSLNQIQGGNPTQIFGNLNANGQVFLINANGMIFGSTANINVGGLVASTLGTDASTFMSGSNVLDAGGDSVALMSNTGTINASAGGVSLIAGKAVNSGTITANAGTINLVGADRVMLVFEPGGFGVTVEKPLQIPLDSLAVENSGSLIAAGGQVRLEARSLPGLFSQLINNSGVISAAGIAGGNDGSVMLVANGGSGATAIGGSGSINVGSGSLGYASTAGIQQTGVLTAGELSLGVGGNAAFTASNRIALVRGDVGGNLNLQNARDLGQSGGLTVGGSALFASAYNLALDSADNDFAGPVRIIARDATIRDSNSLTLGTQSVTSLTVRSGGALNLGDGVVGGALSATSGAGGITQTGALSVTGAASIDAGTGAITLTRENDFGGSLALAGRGITVVDTNNLTVGSINNAGIGDINLTARGSLTMPAGAINSNGALVLSADGGALALGGALTGNAVSLYSRTALNLGHSITSAGSLTVVTGDSALTQTAGTLSVAGTSVLHTETGAISLDGAGNHFGGPVNVVGGTTRIRDAGALTLGTISTGGLTATSNGALNLGTGIISGALSATSNGGAISQGTAALNVRGPATLDAGTGTITLTRQNDFADNVSLTGGNISVTDANDLTIAAINNGGVGTISLRAAGSLWLPASGLTTSGNLTLAAGGGTLGLGGALNASNISLYSQNAMNLANNITTSGALFASTSGTDINQSGNVLSIGGQAVFSAGAGAILLGGPNNHFTGPVDLAGGTTLVRGQGNLNIGVLNTGALTLISDGTLNLGSGTAASVTASSNGAVTQNGALTVNQASNINAGTGSITLGDAGNDFRGSLALTGGDISVNGRDSLAIASVGGSGNRNIALTAGGQLALPSQAIDVGTGSLRLASVNGVLSTAGMLRGNQVDLAAGGGILLNHDIDAGDLALTTTGAAILQTAGALTVQGDATVDAVSGVIALQGTTNDFSTLWLRGNGIDVSDRNDLNITSLMSDGNSAIRLTALGNLTLPAQTIATGAADFSALLGGTLGLNGALSGRNVTLYTGGSLRLDHDVSASQALNLHSTAGAITQSAGALTAGTTASVTAAGDVTLDSTGNRFGTGLSLVGRNLSVTDHGDLTLLTLDVGPNGNVALNAGGALRMPAHGVDAGSGTLSLVSRGGAFSTNGDLSGGGINVTARDGIVLGHTITATDALALSSTNAAITQTAGALNVGTSTTVDAGTGNIALGSAANTLAGVVTLTAGNVQIAATALTLGALSTNALTATSGSTLKLGSGTVRGALTATSSNAAITQAGALSVGGTTTLNAGSGAITLADTGNAFSGVVSLHGGDAVVRTGTALILGDSQLTALQVDTAGDLTLDGRLGATAIDLSAGGVFRNTRGADALTAPGGRWLVRLLDPAGGHLFNGLDSGNTALWNIGAGDAVSQAGNRYAFAFQPVLTVSSDNAGKVYGSVADLDSRWSVTGFMDGVAGAYAGDDVAGVLTGAPTLDSLGAGATATVAGGPYRIVAGLGTLGTGTTGYLLTTADTGWLTVTPASLLIQAGNAGKIYGGTANLTAFNALGLLNGDAVTSVQQRSAGQAGTAGVGSYAIDAGNALGVGLSNYDIRYASGRLTVDPATLRVIAPDAFRAPGGPALLTYYTEGLFNADTVTSASLSSDGTSSLANPGAYAITVGDAAGTGLSNYRIEYVPGTLRVNGFNPLVTAGATQAVSAILPTTTLAMALPRTTTARLPAHTVSAIDVPAIDAPATCLRDTVLGQCTVD